MISIKGPLPQFHYIRVQPSSSKFSSKIGSNIVHTMGSFSFFPVIAISFIFATTMVLSTSVRVSEEVEGMLFAY